MDLPFTHDQFLDVFAAYNTTFLSAAVLLWTWTLYVAWRWVRDPLGSSNSVAWLLAAHWAWSGAVYHLVYFRAVNPAALVFGLLFLLQAALFARLAVGATRLDFGAVGGVWRGVGMTLIGYGLVYPAIGLAFGLDYPRMPSFGVPCPTVVLTIGFLLGANLHVARWIALVPLAWTVVGGSAAFLLGIRADLVLVLAGGVLLVRGLSRPGRGEHR